MKILSYLLPGGAILAGFAAIAAWFLTNGKLDQKQSELDALNNRLTSTQADLGDARDQLASLQSDLQVTRQDLAASKQQVTRFQDDYYRATQEVTQLQNALKSEQAAVEKLVSDNDRLRREILAVKSAPPPDIDNSEVVRGYKQKIAEMEQEIRDLQGNLSNTPMTTASRINLPASGGSQPLPASGAGSITANVAAVRPEQGIVVLDRGFRDGVQRNQEYALLHNGNRLGKIRVTALTDSGAVGLFISSTDRDQRINVGDPVVLDQ